MDYVLPSTLYNLILELRKREVGAAVPFAGRELSFQTFNARSGNTIERDELPPKESPPFINQVFVLWLFSLL